MADFERWKAVFDSHLDDHLDAGLFLKNLWRGFDEPNNVFFLFEVRDLAKARAFLKAPESEEAGRISGVLDGEAHFVESDPSAARVA